MTKGETLEKNEDKNCFCGGLLKTAEHYPFVSGIFYYCDNCKAGYHKIKFMDMKGISYFQLMKIRGI